MYIDHVFKDTFYIEIDDVRLRVYDSGREREYNNNTTLVFLHGSPGQISNWKYLVNFFKNEYRVIAYDQRGYGLSDKPRTVSMEDYISDLKKLLGKLGILGENVVLVGHSFGGMVAQEFAARYNIKGLVLIGSLIKLKPDLMDFIIWYLPSFIWRKILFTENILTRKAYRDLFFSKKTPDKVFYEFLRDNKDYLESAPAHMFRYLKYFRNYDATEILRKINCPTLIIVGRDDKVTPPSESENIHKLIKNSKQEIIEDAGHLVLYEKHDILCKLIGSFIYSLD